MIARLEAALALLALAGLALVLVATRGERESEPGDARAHSLERQVAEGLAGARAARTAMHGTTGEERVRARELAVATYEELGARWPEELEVAAEAAFRAGELLRAGGYAEDAQAAFARARDAGGGANWRARAVLELGHLARRAKKLERAFEHYSAVSADASAPAEYRDEAALWESRMLAEQDRTADALRILRRVSQTAQSPLDRVRAFDQIALFSLKNGDLEATAGVLQSCREELADVALEQTELGLKIRNALRNMRALERLRNAIEERRNAQARTR